MATITDVATWITTTKLKRTDITTEAVDAVLAFYRVLCGKIPFEALQQKSAEIACVAGTDTYSLASLTPKLNGIMSIRYTASSTRRWRLRRSDSRVYDAITYSTGSDPRTYARFGTSIELSPTPSSSSATFRVRYWSAPTIADVVGNTVLLTPDEWEELIRWEALWRVYTTLEMHEKAAQLVMPMPIPRQPSPKRTLMFEYGIIPRLWNDLLQTIRQREAIDEDFGVNPISRSYTHVA